MNNNILNRKFKYADWNVSLILVFVNIAVFILTGVLDVRIKGISLTYWLSLIPVFINNGFVWQFFTYMFVHGSVSHLLLNMYALYIFGSNVEKYIGSREFILYYFVCGLFGGLLSYITHMVAGSYLTATLGASGSIYALLFLSAVLFPKNRLLLFFFIPMSLPFAVLLFIVIEIVSQFAEFGTSVAHLTHLYSIFGGWIYCLVRFRISPFKVFKAALS